jgi:hypothetical protein
MSTVQPTLAEIRRLFQETGQILKEVSASQKELTASQKELTASQKELTASQKESALRFQETERLLKESSLETERQFQETERRFREGERRLQETERLLKESSLKTERKIKAVTKNLGEIGNRLGEFVEHMVAPSVVKLFRSLGVEVHEVHTDVSAKRDGKGIQVDLLVVNDGAVIAVECKSKMSTKYVDEHVARMEKLKQMLPAYQHHQTFGAVAALVMPDEVARYAEDLGFYVLAQSGETLKVRNEKGFCAKAW